MKIDRQFLLESKKGGVVAGRTNLDKIFIIRENSSPFLSPYPETRRTLCSATEPQTAVLCDECWQALIGGDWWSFWPGPITARHSQGRAALCSPQKDDGPGDSTVKAPRCSMSPSEGQPRGRHSFLVINVLFILTLFEFVREHW